MKKWWSLIVVLFILCGCSTTPKAALENSPSGNSKKFFTFEIVQNSANGPMKVIIYETLANSKKEIAAYDSSNFLMLILPDYSPGYSGVAFIKTYLLETDDQQLHDFYTKQTRLWHVDRDCLASLDRCFLRVEDYLNRRR